MKSLALGSYHLFERMTKFAYLHFLWVSFSLIGFIILGIMPATAGMFAVVRKWLNEGFDIPIFQVFWNSFRKDFWKTNIIGFFLFLMGYILTIHTDSEIKSI